MTRKLAYLFFVFGLTNSLYSQPSKTITGTPVGVYFAKSGQTYTLIFGILPENSPPVSSVISKALVKLHQSIRSSAQRGTKTGTAIKGLLRLGYTFLARAEYAKSMGNETLHAKLKSAGDAYIEMSNAISDFPIQPPETLDTSGSHAEDAALELLVATSSVSSDDCVLSHQVLAESYILMASGVANDEYSIIDLGKGYLRIGHALRHVCVALSDLESERHPISRLPDNSILVARTGYNRLSLEAAKSILDAASRHKYTVTVTGKIIGSGTVYGRDYIQAETISIDGVTIDLKYGDKSSTSVAIKRLYDWAESVDK